MRCAPVSFRWSCVLGRARPSTNMTPARSDSERAMSSAWSNPRLRYAAFVAGTCTMTSKTQSGGMARRIIAAIVDASRRSPWSLKTRTILPVPVENIVALAQAANGHSARPTNPNATGLHEVHCTYPYAAPHRLQARHQSRYGNEAAHRSQSTLPSTSQTAHLVGQRVSATTSPANAANGLILS